MFHFLFTFENYLNDRILRILRIPLRWLPDIPRWLYTAVIIVGVLLLSTALPLVPSRLLILLPGFVLAIGAFIIYSRQPALGLIALVITAMFVPSPQLPGGFNFAVLLLMLLMGLWLLDMLVIKREIRLISSRPVRPLLALVLVAVLAFGFGQLPWFLFAQAAPLDAQIGGLMIYVLAVGAFLIAAHQLQDLRWLQWLTWVFIALGALFIAGWVVPGVGGITSNLFQIGAVSNSMFWTWLVVLAFSQAYLNEKLDWHWRLILGGVAAATLFAGFVLNNGWKSGYLPPIAAVAVIIALRNWRIGLLMAVVAPIGAFYLSQDAIATDEYSYSTRVDAWLIILEMVKVNPILGFGPSNYYWYTPLFPIRGYAVQFNSHSQILDLIAQTGVLGLLCFFWFFWEMGWLSWQLLKKAQDGFARAYVYGVLGGVVGTLVAALLADWILPFPYNIGLNGFRGSILAWVFMGGLVAVEQLTQRQLTSQ